MDECQTKIDDNNAQIDKLQDKLSKRARNMYRDGQTTFLDVILGSNSFDDFAKNWDTLTSLNEKDSEMVEQTKNLRADNEAQKQEYANQADIAQQKVEEADAAQKQAEELVQQYQNEVDSLDSRVAELLAEEEAAAQKAAEEAAAAAAQAEAANNASSDNGGSNNSASNGGGSSNNAPSNAGGSNNNASNNGGGSNTGGNSSSGGGSNNYGGSVVAAAQSQLGVPYVWGGTAWGSGLDCSGLTSGCWSRAAGIWIGRTTWDQIASAQWTGSVSEAQAGDVYACGSHVAIATGGGGYIHAPQPGEVVCYSSLSWYNPSTAPCAGTKRELERHRPRSVPFFAKGVHEVEKKCLHCSARVLTYSPLFARSRDVAQFGRALRSGTQRPQVQILSSRPFNRTSFFVFRPYWSGPKTWRLA